MQRTPTRIPPGHPIPAFPECRRRGASSRSPSGKSGLCRRAGRSGICFPTSLCDLIGILAQALARVMEPESQGPDPPPPQGICLRVRYSETARALAGVGEVLPSLRPALSSCLRWRPPRPGAPGQRRPRQAPPHATRAPPATRRPQPPIPGAWDH